MLKERNLFGERPGSSRRSEEISRCAEVESQCNNANEYKGEEQGSDPE